MSARAGVAVAAAGFLAAAGCASAPNREIDIGAAATADTTPSTAPARRAAPPPREPIVVLYRGEARPSARLDDRVHFTGTANLLGVDAEHGTAIASYAGLEGDRVSEVYLLDFGGDRSEKVSALTRDPKPSELSELARRLAPFEASPTEAHGLYPSVMSWKRELVAFEDGHDAVAVFDRAAKKSVVASPGIRAAYTPLFSPRGDRLAMTGCNERTIIPPGAIDRCVYKVYLADAPFGGAPRPVNDVVSPRAPVWSPDGAYVYAVTRDDDHDGPFDQHDRGGCLHRIEASTTASAKLWCTDQMDDMDFEESKSGKLGIVFGHRRGGKGSAVALVSLPDGKELGVYSVPGFEFSIGSGLGDDGLVVDTWQGDLYALDLARGVRASMPLPRDERLVAYRPWKDAHTVYALATAPGADAASVYLLEVDAASLLRGPTQPLDKLAP